MKTMKGLRDFSLIPRYDEDLIREHVYHMQTRGYSVFEDFYTHDECDFFTSKLQAAIDAFKPAGSERSYLDQFHLHDLLCNEIYVAKSLEDPRIQQVLEPMLSPYWILYAHTSSSLPPGGGSNFGSRIHVDSPRLISGYPTNVGVMWALCDFTPENGATKVLPGSLHSIEVPDEDLFERNCVQLTCKKGAMIVFNARLFHRAGINNSKDWRHSLTMNVCRPFMKQRMDWVRFIPEEIANQLNAQARRIIGYDSRIPKSLDEFFRDESERLYKPGQE